MDDFSSVPLPSGSARSVNVIVTFKDSSNALHTANQTLDVNGNVSVTQSGARAGFAGSGNTSPANAARPGGNNPLGFLLGGRPGGAASGPNYVIIGIAIVIVAAGGFLVYRHFKKGKKVR